MRAKQCTFVRLHATEGGAFLLSAGDLHIDKSLFALNQASRGGALAARGSTPHVSGSTFQGNQARIAGGALSVSESGSLVLDACNFTDNEAEGQGAALDYDPLGFISDGLRPFVRANTFRSNRGLSTVRYTNVVKWVLIADQILGQIQK